MTELKRSKAAAAALTVAAIAATAVSAVWAATEPPRHKEWAAVENRMPGPGPEDRLTTLIVSGEVETTNGAIRPKLAHAGERLGEPEAFVVTMTLENSGEPGTTDVSFREALERFDVPLGRYKTLYVLYEGEPIAGPIRVSGAY